MGLGLGLGLGLGIPIPTGGGSDVGGAQQRDRRADGEGGDAHLRGDIGEI